MGRKKLLLFPVLLLALVCLVNFLRVETPFADLEREDILRVESRCMSEVPRELTAEQVDELLVLLRQVRLHHRFIPVGQLNGSLHSNCMFTLFMADDSEVVIGAGDERVNEFVLNYGYWRSEWENCQAIHDWHAELWADSGWLL